MKFKYKKIKYFIDLLIVVVFSVVAQITNYDFFSFGLGALFLIVLDTNDLFNKKSPV